MMHMWESVTAQVLQEYSCFLPVVHFKIRQYQIKFVLLSDCLSINTNGPTETALARLDKMLQPFIRKVELYTVHVQIFEAHIFAVFTDSWRSTKIKLAKF